MTGQNAESDLTRFLCFWLMYGRSLANIIGIHDLLDELRGEVCRPGLYARNLP